jgi:hypothetical protein
LQRNDFIIHFFSLWKNSKLPHFNIFLGPKNEDLFLQSIIDHFLIEVLVKEQSFSQGQAKEVLEKGHADILWINKSSIKRKSYRIQDNDFEDMLKFLEYKPLQLNKRFIIIRDADLLSYALCNKLLKTLEEPNQDTIIIFLAPEDTNFIQTIISRARVWHISATNIEESLYKDYLSFKNFTESELITNNKILKEYFEKEFSAQIQKSKKSIDIDIDIILNLFLEYESNSQSSYKNKNKLLEIIKKYQYDKVFNGSHIHILAELNNIYCS